MHRFRSVLQPTATKRKSGLHSHQTAPSSRAKPVPRGSTQRWLQRGGMRGITYCQQVEGRDGLPLLTSHPSDRSSWTHDSACGPINKVSQLTRNRRCYLLPKPTKKGCLSQHALLRRVARDALGPERHLFHRPGIRSESFCFSIDQGNSTMPAY